MSTLPPGSRIGRFEVSGLLGEGAMGVVYLGHDPQIERPVAIKTLRPQGGGTTAASELESRFLKEAKLAGRLQHPNVVTIYEAGQDNGLLYIAMEYVDGESLTRYLGSPETLTLRDRVEVVRQVALALQHAHERGVVHRDVKPGNILLTRDRRVKVADFGIGKLLSGTADLTRTGQMIGSPAYMSPEQIRGEKLDGRSDLFSLGVVFYELLTGTRPFPGDSITTLVYQILHMEPRDPLAIRADLPPSTRELFSRLLAKSPERRPADASEFLRVIRPIADQLSEEEHTIAFPSPAATTPMTLPAAFSADAPAPAGPAAASGAREAPPPPAPAPRRTAGALYLFAIAAVLVALAFLVTTWRRSRGGPDGPAPAPTPTGSVPAVLVAGTAVPTVSVATPAPPPTLGPLPTAGPASAADAVVGAPRYTGPSPTRRERPTPETRAAAQPPPPPVEEPAPPRSGRESSSALTPDNVYRARRFAKIGVSPDQARMYVDGRYVGIADDWDDRGGGRRFEFVREGTHRLRFELPGYRDVNVEVLVTPGAGDDTVDVGDELKRESRVPYPRLSSPAERTVGPVVFEVDPTDATITEGSRTLGPASAFGRSSPLKLSGPMVHDLVISAPGHKPKAIRILVAPNADNESARVKVELKKE